MPRRPSSEEGERLEEEPLATETADPGSEPSGDGDVSAEEEHDEAVDRPTDDAESPSPSTAEGREAEAGEADADEPHAGEDAPAEEPLARAERERDEYLALAQRKQADFDNFRKRAAREAAEAGNRAKGNLVRELLPVVDNLERALASAGEGEQHLADGVRLVHAELLGVLSRGGVEGFDPTGEPFDPTLHEALSTRDGDGAEPGTVLDVVEKGYRLGGSVLRPARVVVSA